MTEALREALAAVVKKARDGLGAGSRSTSGCDYELEFGGSLIDSIAEGIEDALEAKGAEPAASTDAERRAGVARMKERGGFHQGYAVGDDRIGVNGEATPQATIRAEAPSSVHQSGAQAGAVQRPAGSDLAHQVANAQREVASWTPERRERVQLQGPARTCLDKGCWLANQPPVDARNYEPIKPRSLRERIKKAEE